MSGFEVIGVILFLYPLVEDALKAYRSVTSGKFVDSLQKDVLTEQIIFRDFLAAVVLPVVSKKDFLRLTTPASFTLAASQGVAVDPSPYTVSLYQEDRGYSEGPSWRDVGLLVHASLERVFAPDKAQLILDTLEEIHHHLRAIQADVSASSTGSVSYGSSRTYLNSSLSPDQSSLRERLGTTATAFRNARRGSTFREKLANLHHLNDRLRRLLKNPRMPTEYGSSGNPQVQHETSRHDFHAMYHAIKTGYRCKCQRPHSMKLGLPQIRASSRQATISDGQSSRGVTGLSLLFSTEDDFSIETQDDSLSLVGSVESLRTNPRTSSHNLQQFESSGSLTAQDDDEKL
jgi:hypothetical protein